MKKAPVYDLSVGKRADLSVVIPSYRPGELIYKCLESVFAQNTRAFYEVIVVDSSPDDLGFPIRKRFPRVRFIGLPGRTLSGRARSIGAARAMGRIVFFTDTDCVVNPDWMERLLEGHRHGYRIVGGSIVNGTPDSYVGTTEYLLEFNEMNPFVRAGIVQALPSCNLSVHTSVFQEVGYFPDFMKGEDTIFCCRASERGIGILFRPDAKITHMNRTGLVNYLKNQVSLGEGANETRRRTKRHGSFLIQYPFLIPLIPLYRSWIVGKRFLRSNVSLFWNYIRHYPLVFTGLLFYTWGFIRGPHRLGLSTEHPKRKE